jgi:hypothetical protein
VSYRIRTAPSSFQASPVGYNDFHNLYAKYLFLRHVYKKNILRFSSRLCAFGFKVCANLGKSFTDIQYGYKKDEDLDADFESIGKIEFLVLIKCGKIFGLQLLFGDIFHFLKRI